MSMMLQSTNQRCNALQSTIGIYLHACRASEAVIELLSRIGISISRASIDNTVKNLWKGAHVNIRRVARTLLGGYAWDNFDVEIKHLVPTVEKPQDTLLHLTSGTLLRLDHGVTRDDLCCSEDVWKKSKLNPANLDTPIPAPDWMQLLDIHPDEPDSAGMDRRDRFNRWKFLADLVRYGPAYFRAFADDLEEPESVDMIPVVKSEQVPLEAMDINQSSAQGNADALVHMFKQGGVGDPQDSPGAESIVDVGDHVILVHGDLSTCERVQSIQASRRVERTPWRRLQPIVFCMGLFHLKMACANAIWKIFIQP